jgi:hypothetical protein
MAGWEVGFAGGHKPEDCQWFARILHSGLSGIGHAVAGCEGILGMLDHCANPGCGRRFRKLEDGKLFLVEVDVVEAAGAARGAGTGRHFRHLEHYWLCDPCASVLTLSFEQGRGVVAIPLVRPLGKMPAASVRLGEIAGGPSSGVCDHMQMARGGVNEA